MDSRWNWKWTFHLLIRKDLDVDDGFQRRPDFAFATKTLFRCNSSCKKDYYCFHNWDYSYSYDSVQLTSWWLGPSNSVNNSMSHQPQHLHAEVAVQCSAGTTRCVA